ncbi:MAG: nucleoside-diphosphate sugar epimerase/dehydratase [Desulfomonilaceae bacterium]
MTLTTQLLLSSYKKLKPYLKFKYWIFIVSATCAAISLWFAYQIRFDFDIPKSHQDFLPLSLLLVISIKECGVYVFSFHTLSWRHTGLRSTIKVILYALTCASAIIVIGNLLPQIRVPLGVVLIDTNLTVIWAGLAIFSARLVRDLFIPMVMTNGHKKQKAVLIGAGDAANLVLREIIRTPNADYAVKAIFDDAPWKRGLVIQGVRVLGAVDKIKEYVVNNEVDVVLIAIASASSAQMRIIYDKIKDLKVSVKTLPSLLELINESRPLIEFRDINIQDLLGRQEVMIRYRDIEEIIANKIVLVTGAGGSIGSEICSQVLNQSPRALLLLERSENLLFHIHRRLTQRLGNNSETKLIPLLMDCKDYDSVRYVFEKHRPNMVLHAAAHKHVPLQEENPTECFRNNVGGIQTMVRVSHEAFVERFVLISTDKAVEPVNVMGASKRACELYTQAYGEISPTKFMAVRFGNVLGSEGSVVPTFLEQIRQGGPVTVTHEDVTRYFMSIPEAVALVLQAAAIGNSGQLMMLDMGNPVKIVDLARQLIFLAGKTEHEIGVTITGLRPGEKLFEELSCNWETCLPTEHEKIRIFRQTVDNPEKTIRTIDDWVAAAFRRGNAFNARVALRNIVPEYRPLSLVRVSPPRFQTAGTVSMQHI